MFALILAIVVFQGVVEPKPQPPERLLAPISMPAADCRAEVYAGRLELVKRVQLLPIVNQAEAGEALKDFSAACELLDPQNTGDSMLIATRRWRVGQKRLRQAFEAKQQENIGPDFSPRRLRKVLLRGPGRVVFAANKERVWNAVIESLFDSGIRPESMDKSSGTVFLRAGSTWGSRWGAGNDAVRRLSNKNVRRLSTWQAVAAEGDIYVKPLSEGTEVRVNLRLSGCNGAQSLYTNFSCIWEPLISNGTAERVLLSGVEEKLPERFSSSGSLNNIHGDPKAVEAARRVVLIVQKVDSALELQASRDEILRRLVDAHSSIIEFDSSSEGGLLPRLIKSLRRVVLKYRAALDKDGSDYDDTLSSARVDFAVAKKYLKNFERYGQEQNPSTR